MPRKNCMTINAPETVQYMFDKFTELRGTKKTDAFADMLEMYMLATDEDLYLKLKKDFLKFDVMKQMLADRDLDSIDMQDEMFIFMKLANAYDNAGIPISAHDTMQAYIDDQATRGYTWFSTQALYYGMSPKRVAEYNKAIENGKKVTILFAIGKAAGGENDIAYSANVLEVRSFTQPTGMDEDEYPDIFRGEKARIWLKIDNLKPEKRLTAKLFKITSSEVDLQQVINMSQYHFGYVSLKD